MLSLLVDFCYLPLISDVHAETLLFFLQVVGCSCAVVTSYGEVSSASILLPKESWLADVSVNLLVPSEVPPAFDAIMPAATFALTPQHLG